MKKWMVLLAALTALAVACGNKGGGPGGDDDDDDTTTSSPSPSPTVTYPPGWEPLAPLPELRQEHPALAFQDEVWVFGGFHSGFDISGTVEAYDPVSNTWRNDIRPIGDPVEQPMHHANVAAANGTIYVVGFLQGNFDPDGRVYEYDVVNNVWSEKTSMPAGTERGASQLAAIGDLIYVAGGLRSGAVANFSVYDTVNDMWTELDPLPEAIDHGYGAVVNGVFYVFGGRAGAIGSVNDTTYAYDPAGTAMWETRASIPTGRGGIAGAVGSDGRVYIFGGEGNPNDPSGVWPQVEAYDPMTDMWEQLDDMPDPRHGMGAAAIGDTIYIPGGGEVQSLGAVNRHDAYTVQ